MGERRTGEGIVVSDAMQKTRVVEIERVFRHPRYQRVIRRSKKVKVHDEANESRVGDRVIRPAMVIGVIVRPRLASFATSRAALARRTPTGT